MITPGNFCKCDALYKQVKSNEYIQLKKESKNYINLTQAYLRKRQIHEIQTKGKQNEKCWGALHEDLLRNLKSQGVLINDHLVEKVTVLFEPLYMYDLSFISALRMTFSYFSTKSLSSKISVGEKYWDKIPTRQGLGGDLHLLWQGNEK